MKEASLKGKKNHKTIIFILSFIIFFLFFAFSPHPPVHFIYFRCNYCDNYTAKQRSQQAHTKPAQTTTNYFSHNKINHKNSYLNVPDYYRCNNDDDAAIVDAIDEDCIDKNDNSNNKRIAESGAQTEQINGNENDCHYQRPFVKIKCDESTFSRCILLVLGSICQQGKNYFALFYLHKKQHRVQ